MLCGVNKTVGSTACTYSMAGVIAIYIANFYPQNEGDTAADGTIKYTETDGEITKIELPKDEKFYKVIVLDGTGSATDGLLVGGNGGKYRQHAVNAVVADSGKDVQSQIDALSLGRFIMAVQSKNGKIRLYGRTSGLTAPAGGADLNTGAQDADASGWTLIQQGVSVEVAPFVKDVTALPLEAAPIITD